MTRCLRTDKLMCETCDTGKGFDFETLPEATMAEAARGAHAAREAWHFHVLAPACAFNPNPGKYTFLLELTAQERMICTIFDDRPIMVNKELLALLHGDAALSEKPSGTAELSEEETELLNHVSTAANLQRNWHHHMMFPACGLNTSDGKWRLFVEIEGDEPRYLDFEAEPSALLNRIERIYFGMN